MQIICIFGAVALLSATTIASPQNKNAGGLLEKRWWWASGVDGDDTWDSHDQHHHSWEGDGNGGDGDDNDGSGGGDGDNGDDESGPWMDSSPSFSSCAIPVATAVPVTTTIFVTINTTVTQYRTRHHHSHNTGYITGLSVSSVFSPTLFTNSSSTTMPLSTRYATGFSSSSVTVLPLYANVSNSSTPLSIAYSTGLSAPSSLAPVFYNNTTNLPTTSFTIHKNTHTRTHHFHHTHPATIISSMIFIPASSSSLPSEPITGSPASNPTTTLAITTTISGLNAPTGTPVPHALLCDVHGFPVGDFFLGQLVESKAGVDVTLESCFEFCASIFGNNMGCLSIDFYPEPGTDAPRCDLYDGSVAQSLDMVLPQAPNRWFDVGCVLPSNT